MRDTAAQSVYENVPIKTRRKENKATEVYENVPGKTVRKENKERGKRVLAEFELEESPQRRWKLRVALLLLVLLFLTAIVTAIILGLHMKGQTDVLTEATNSTTETTATLGTTTTASTSTASCSSVLHCDVGWELYGTKCYNFSVQSLKLTWSESREKCQSYRGDLVEIKSRDKQDFLEGRVTSLMCSSFDRFWIGLTDSQTEGEWLWCDGSPLNQSLAFWTRNSYNTEPDNWKYEDEEGENCAVIGELKPIDKLSWYDVSCKKRNRFICDKPADSSTTCG